MNTRYPEDKWLHILTDGSQIEGYINAGAGIHCEHFSCYMPLGQHSNAFDGEIEAIRIALRVLNHTATNLRELLSFLTQRLQ